MKKKTSSSGFNPFNIENGKQNYTGLQLPSIINVNHIKTKPCSIQLEVRFLENKGTEEIFKSNDIETMAKLVK